MKTSNKMICALGLALSLMPFHAAFAEDAPTVEIPDEYRKTMGVKVVAAKTVPISRTIKATGRVETDEKRVHEVNTKYEGWIEKLYADYTGKPVKKGEPLAEIYSPELYSTQMEYIEAYKWAVSASEAGNDIAESNARDSARMLNAARLRLSLWDITDEQIAILESTGIPKRTLTIYSPADGVITEKSVVSGMRVMPGEGLFTITGFSGVWVVADVYENETAYVKPGQTAKITFANRTAGAVNAKVDYIYPSLTTGARTLKVRFDVPNPSGELKPGMFADVVMKIDSGKGLAVARDAVMDTGERKVVYVDKGEGYFEPRSIETGATFNGMIEVVSGLSEGEAVAASASFLIDSEAQFRGIAPSK